MKRIVRLTERDLTRIDRRVIKEQEDTVKSGGGGSGQVGSTMSNGKRIFKFTPSEQDSEAIFVQTEDSGAGQMFYCGRHEQGKYALHPSTKITQEESQAIYDQFCK